MGLGVTYEAEFVHAITQKTVRITMLDRRDYIAPQDTVLVVRTVVAHQAALKQLVRAINGDTDLGVPLWQSSPQAKQQYI